jgi:hypothetical protein
LPPKQSRQILYAAAAAVNEELHFLMAQTEIASAVFVTEEFVSFNDVLEGKLGPREAGAARFWVEQGSIIEPLPNNSDWISTDAPAGCYDTRVWEPVEDEDDAANIVKSPQKPKPKAAAKPRTTAAAQNMYSKAAFVGHSDTLGTLSRRKARSSKHPDDPNSSDADASGSRAANDAIEKLPPSAALAKLPSGWRVKDLILDGPRDTKILDGRLYVSPSGIVCRSYETAKAMSKSEKVQCKWYDLKSAIAWVKAQSTASRAAIKSNIDVVFPRYIVALQRRKAAIKPKSRSGTRMVSKNRKRKQEGDGKKEVISGRGGSESRDDRALKRHTTGTPSSGVVVSGKPASGEKEKDKKRENVAPLPRKKSRKSSVVERIPGPPPA